MFLYSAQYVTDLGFKQQCEEEWTDKSTARYVVFNLNLSSMPLTLRNGHCVPNVCSQLQFDGIGEYISIILTGLVQEALKNVKDADFFLHEKITL